MRVRSSRSLCVAVLLAVVGSAAAPRARAGRREPLATLTTPDPGTRGAALARLISHPSLLPGRARPMSDKARQAFVKRVLGHYEARGARSSRDGAVQRELRAAWDELRPLVASRYGVDLTPRLHVIAGGGGMLEARAFPDGSLLVHRNDVEYARSVARAVAAAGLEDRPALLRNLAIVARSAQQGKFRVTFGRHGSRKLYSAALRGVLVSLLGHELAHVAGDHPGLDFSGRPRKVRAPAELKRRAADYFPARTRRVISSDGLVQGRQLLFAQAQEADADRAAVDLAVAGKLPVEGLVADMVVGAMLDGLRPRAVGNHPPGLYRFDDTRARLQHWGLRSFADGVTRADLARAMRDARAATR